MSTPDTIRLPPVVQDPGEGTAIWHLDTLSPPLHVHSEGDEAWFVLDGELTFQVGNRTWSATEGSFVWAPRGLPHTFRVDSSTARLLALAVPGRGPDPAAPAGRPTGYGRPGRRGQGARDGGAGTAPRVTAPVPPGTVDR